MAFSPFARFRNFTVDNLKLCLAVYPDMAGKMEWNEVSQEIETMAPGYKRTSYQQACQFGLEDRGRDEFRIQNYLYAFDDENLEKYVEFWIKTYFAPNPYVKGTDDPILLYCEIVKAIWNQPNHELDYNAFFSEKVGGGSDDILFNAIKSYAAPIKAKRINGKDILYIENADMDAALEEVEYIENHLPIGDPKDKKQFFDRFSFENFCGFFNLNLELPKESEESLQRQFEKYILEELELKNTRQVAELEKISRKMLELGVIVKDVYCIADVEEYRQAVHKIKKSEWYSDYKTTKKEKNPKSGLASDQGMTNYEKFLIYLSRTRADNVSDNERVVVNPHTGFQSDFARNRIVFGAPGTGKSFTLNKEKGELLKEYFSNYERVTFHPNYSYANFVGTYKPVSQKDKDGNDMIKYEYVPGPFMRVYVKALKNSMNKENIQPFLLLIEEINRANVAAVFGDVFQLLDRNSDNVSEYTVQATEDMKNYLASELKCRMEDISEIKIPDNMFIWATMNSADQGVFPMDTAFKRRWEFEYIGINAEANAVEGYVIPLGNNDNRRYVKWNDLRVAINNILASDECKVNEDKLLGPFFLSKNVLENALKNEDKFVKAFESKVIMYLFEDAVKMRPKNIFKGHKGKMIFSEICETFEYEGEGLFGITDISYCDKFVEIEK